MPDRRTNAADARAKLEEKLNRDAPDDDTDSSSSQSGGHGRTPAARGSHGADGDMDMGFEPITDAQQQEVNDLFKLINSNGYMTEGMYNLQADPDGNAVVSISVILPSSPGSISDTQSEKGSE